MKSLYVGATGSGERFSVGKLNSGDTEKFSVIGASGNTDIQGTLNVEGNTTIQDSVTINASNENFKIQNGSAVDKFTVDTDNGNTVIEGTVNINGVTDIDADFAVRNGTTDKFFVDNVTGNTNIEGTLTADGHTELNSTLNVDSNTTIGGTLEVTNNTEINGTLDVDANFAVRSGTTDKMTVASSTGNIATDGTLVVAGQTTINDSLIIQSDNEVVNVNNGSGVTKFSIDTDNGNTNIIGTLTVGDATQINDTFGTSGVNTFTNNTEQTLTGTYAADGAVRLTGGAGIGKNLAVGGGLRVYGGTELSGALDLNSSANISGSTIVENQLIVKADNKFFKVQTAGAVDKFTIDTDNGNTVSQGDLTVAGDVNAQSNLIVTGNLTVNGTTSTVNSTTVTIDDPVFTLGGDTAPASNDGKDRGIEFRYFDGSAKLGFFGFDRGTSEFAFMTSATNNSEVFSGTDGALRVGSVHVTGAGTSVDIDNNLNVDGTATVDGQIISQLAQGTAPFVVASTTKVNNLNADLLDGLNTSATDTTGNSVVVRSSGDFSANQITVNSGAGSSAGILGNASTADAWKTARTLTIDGVVDGSVSINGASDPTLSVTFNDADITALAAQSGTGYMVRTAANTYAHRTFAVTASSGITLTNADGISGNTTINVASASTNASNNLVLRDGSGNFASNQITSKLVAQNIQVGVTGANEIDTSTGNLTLDSAGGTVAVDDILTVAGSTTLNDDLTLVSASGGNIVFDKSDNALVFGDNVAVKLGAGTDIVIESDGTDTLYKSTGSSKQIIQTAQFEVKSQDGTSFGMIIDADGSATLGYNGTATFVTTSTGATLTGDLLSDSNNTRSIGSSSNKYANVHSTTFTGNVVGNIQGDITGNIVATTSTAKNLNPASDSAFDLGTNSVRWQNIYADAANITAITGTLTGTVSSIANHDTDALSEGSTNLYFTNERVDDRVNALIVAGTGITKVYDDTAGTYTLTVTQADVNTDTITEGSSNLFTTAARSRTHFTYGTGIALSGGGELTVTQSDISTDNVTEGSTNLFTTAARTRTHFTYGTGITHSSGTLSVTQADINTDNVTEGSSNLFTTAARTRSHFTYGTGITHDGSGALSVTQADINTDNVTEGSTNVFFTNARADARVAAATGANLDLSSKSTTNLSEGTNQYYTEARVQAKLDNAFAQLSAMLNNLATSTTLTLGLSGDPTPGAVVTTGVSVGGGGGFTGATGVATSGGTGSSLTVDTTVDSDGNITAAAVNAGGSGYLITDTVTITNANAGKVLTLNLASLVGGTGYTSATGISATGGDGSALTVDITASAGAITNVTVNNAGTGYAAANTVTIANANASGIKTLGSISAAGSGYSTGTAIATSSSGSGSSATLNITSVDASGGITGVAINDDGSGYAASEVLTITNANASGIATTGNVGAADASRAAGTYTIGTSDYITQADGANATFSIVVDGSGAATITVTDDGSGFIANETVTVADAQLGSGGGAALTFDVTAIHGSTATVPVSAIHGNGATVDVATVATNATLTLTDITTMEVGATVTGATSGTTGVITALGTNQVTVDNVDGFFKSGEVVSANDVTTLTISSFS
jgi:hypothetical protein